MWDLWVVSAANNKQKTIFENQIDLLKKMKKLPKDFNCLVIPDPKGIKAGSGGATINIYNTLKLIYPNNLESKRVLVIHSGGYSKRLPNYSVKGKLFSNVITENGTFKLLEFFFKKFTKMSEKLKSGMMIASGDVQLDLDFDDIFNDNTIYGLAAKADIDTASQHGVYITSNDKELIRFLHKESISALNKYLDSDGNLNIDTGIVLFPFSILEKISQCVADMNEPLNLYNDFIIPLAEEVDLEYYMNSSVDDGNTREIYKYRKNLYKLLSPLTMKVIELKNSEFIHVGTTEEYIDKLTENKELFIENSIIGRLNYKDIAVIEDSILLGQNDIGKNCIISDVITKQDVQLEEGLCLQQIPVVFNSQKGYITKKHRININPKETKNYLWDDKIYWFDNDREKSLKAALDELDTEKLSLADCFEYCNIKAISNDVSDIYDRIIALELLENEKNPLINKTILKESILDITGIKMSHTYRYLGEYYGEEYCAKSFDFIRQLILNSASTEIKYDSKLINKKVKVISAVRINIGGGWTDTPPYCYENGGSVMNIAVLPDGKYPIEVCITETNDESLLFECIDQNIELSINTINELNNIDINDSFIIHKYVSIATGLINDSYTRGIRIATYSRLPKGSGLGTSSIIINACLVGIFKAFGLEYDENYLINKTLQIEQMMGAGGGWQDQAGAIYPGIKTIISKPGLPQEYTCNKIELENELLINVNERMLLIYTGKRRKASNILHKVVSNYLLSYKGIYKTFKEIYSMPESLQNALSEKSIEVFAKLLVKSFELNKKLDSGCSNDTIEDILEIIEEYTLGYTICGAGGGGYLLVILKDNILKEEINQRLETDPTLIAVSAINCTISNEPIKVYIGKD